MLIHSGDGLHGREIPSLVLSPIGFVVEKHCMPGCSSAELQDSGQIVLFVGTGGAVVAVVAAVDVEEESGSSMPSWQLAVQVQTGLPVPLPNSKVPKPRTSYDANCPNLCNALL